MRYEGGTNVGVMQLADILIKPSLDPGVANDAKINVFFRSEGTLEENAALAGAFGEQGL